MSEKSPAFPEFQPERVYRNEADRFGETVFVPHGGMTLRDYFAGQALTAVALADLGSRLASGSEDGGLSARQIAECAYIQADAMLKARGEP